MPAPAPASTGPRRTARPGRSPTPNCSIRRRTMASRKRPDALRPSLDVSLRLARRGNVFPLYRALLAAFETPLSAYLKLEGRGPAYLLEAVEQGEHLGRYSFIGCSPAMGIAARGRGLP